MTERVRLILLEACSDFGWGLRTSKSSETDLETVSADLKWFAVAAAASVKVEAAFDYPTSVSVGLLDQAAGIALSSAVDSDQ